MGISLQKNRHGKPKVIVSKRWPDGSRFRRVMPDYTVATKMLARIEEAIAFDTWEELKASLSKRPEEQDPTVRIFAQVYLEEYCQVKNRRPDFKEYELGPIVQILGHVKVKHVRRTHAYEFVTRRSKQVEPATVNRGLAVLKNMMSFAVEKDLLEVNPLYGFKSLPEPVKELRVMTIEEERLLVQCAAELDPVIGAFVAILGETGLRLSEALRLKWTHLDLKQRLLTVTSESKSGKIRHVPLSDFAITYLQSLPRTVGIEWVFLRTRTERWKQPRPLFFKARKQAGLEWVGFHGLRHFRATQWVRLGVDLRTVQELLGHANIGTTQRYAHFALNHAKDEVFRVSDLERDENRLTCGERA